jgi:hypothetical protein
MIRTSAIRISASYQFLEASRKLLRLSVTALRELQPHTRLAVFRDDRDRP